MMTDTVVQIGVRRRPNPLNSNALNLPNPLNPNALNFPNTKNPNPWNPPNTLSPPPAPALPQSPAPLDSRRTIRWGLLALTLAVGGGGLALGRMPLAGAVVASGVVKVADNRKSVQHLEGGLIKEIRTRNGDRVSAGQPLIVLEDERAKASLDLLTGQWDATAAKAARLQAERDFRPAPVFPDALRHRAGEVRIADLLRQETTLFDNKRTALERQLGLLDRQDAELEREIANTQAQLRAEEAAGRLQAEELRVNETAAQQHLVSKVQVLALRRAAQQHLARQAELGAAMARARQRQGDLRLRAAALRNQYLQAAADDLTAVNAQLFDLEEKQRPLRDMVQRQVVVAPLAGQVVDLQVFTVGGVTQPGERLLDIVPDGEPLLVEARIGLDDIDQVQLGQAVEVRLTAYPTRTTPLLSGRIRYVSADQLTDSRTGAPHYLAQVAVEPASLTAAGANIHLQPGMHAELFIQTSERTLLDYLLEPVTASLRRALRES